jgi:DNA-binding HxlR family transcriptional regulator
VRAGTAALSLLAAPLNAQVLERLGEGPASFRELRGGPGSPSEATTRGALRTLIDTGVLERGDEERSPGQVRYALDRAGRDLSKVAEIMRTWLAEAPGGGLAFGGMAAKGAVKTLVDGWSSGIVRAIAARPFSLIELNKLITALTYPSLERRFGAMRHAGLLEACPGNGTGTPYTASGWMRRAIGVLMAAAFWERRYAASEAVPIGRLDFEAAFLLTVPVLKLPATCEGSCRLAVEIRRGAGATSLAGVTATMRAGTPSSCVARAEGRADAWAVGSAGNWLEATVEADLDLLEIGGDGALAAGVVEGLHNAQYGAS